MRVADFLSIIFGAWIRFHHLRVENVPFDRNDCVLTTDHFQKTLVSDQHVLQALRRISKSAGTFIEECANANSADHNDFGLIQSSPLLELEDYFLCLDPEFLIDKAGVAIYWTMRESFPGNIRSKLSSYWGSVVDEYVRWLFETCYSGSGLLLLRPQFADADEACDLWLLEGRQLSIVEVKNSLLSAKAKYGFRADVLE